MSTITNNIRWASNSAELAANLKQGLDQIEATRAGAEKMVQTLSGDRLIAAAHKTAAAIAEIGGASKLTASEAERNFSLIDRAIQKMELTSRTVPAAMLTIRDELKEVAHAQDEASHATGGWLPLLHELGSSWVARIAEGILLRDAIRDIIAKIKELATALPEIALKGAAVADVEENFKRLTAQAGLLGESLMGQLRAGTHNTITDFELMKTVNKDLAAGMVLTDKQFATMAKGAFALAQATGVDVKQAFDTMNDAMLTGRTRALALLTGKIDVTKAEEKYAKSLGTTADHLSEEGKLEASRMAQLEAVGAATERLGEQTDGLDERVAQASTSWENFKENLGKALATSATLEAGLSGLKKALEDALGGTQQEAIKKIAAAVDDVTIGAVRFAEFGVRGVALVGIEYHALKVVLGDVLQVFELLNLNAAKFERIKLNLSDPFALNPEVDTRLKAINADIDAMSKSIAERGKSLQADKAAEEEWSKRGDLMAASLAEIRRKMQEAKDGAKAFIGPIKDSADAQAVAAAAARRHAAMLQASKEELAKAKAEAEKFAAAMVELNSVGQGWQGTLDTIDGSVVESVKYYLLAGVAQDKLATAFKLTAAQVKAIDSDLKADQITLENTIKRIDEFHKVGEEGAAAVAKSFAGMSFVLRDLSVQMGITQIAGKQFNVGVLGLMPDLSDNAKRHMAELRGELHDTAITLDTDFGAAFQRVLGNLPGMVASAFTGGGGLIGAVKGIASMIGSEIGSVIGNSIARIGKAAGDTLGTFGKLLGPIGAAIGSLAGPLIEGLRRLFGGPSQLELEGRKLEASFEAQFGSFQKMLNAVGDVYKATGRTYEQAQADVKALMDAERLGGDAVQAALDKINGAFDEQKQDAADLQTAIQKYGFSIEQLGPAMQRQELNDQAKEILNSWRLLVGSGIDVVAVDQKMASTTWDYLQLAKRTGQEVPAAMKQILQSMLDQGVFTDENGNKLTALGQLGVNFSETMTEGFDKVVAKLQQLLEGLGLVPKALDNIPDKKTIDIGFNLPDGRFPWDEHVPQYAATGGRVTPGGIMPMPQYFAVGGNVMPFRPRGRDTVPAMLTPGELVLTPPAALAYEQVMSGYGGSISTGHGSQQKSLDASMVGGDLHITLELDGRTITKTVIENFRFNKPLPGGSRAGTEARGALGLAS